MTYQKALMAVIAISFCLFFNTNTYSQVITDWERVRKEREAQEARNRQAQQDQERERNTKAVNSKPIQNNTVTKPSISNDKNKSYFLSDKPDANGLLLKMEWDKWGLVDKDGKQITPLIYSNIFPASGKLYGAYLRKESGIYSKGGFINTKGEVVIDFKYDYILKVFENGRAQVELGKLMFFIDEKGNTIEGTVETSLREKKSQAYNAKVITDKAEAVLMADKNYQLGVNSQDSRKWSEALAYYKLAGFPKEPANSEINLRAAICLFEMGPSDASAFLTIRNYEKDGGKDPFLYYFNGVYNLNNYERSDAKPDYYIAEALRLFKEYETKAPVSSQEKTRLNKYYGDCYFHRRDYDNAVLYYMKDAETFSQNWITTSRIIDSYLAKQDVTKAVDYTKSVIKNISAFEKAQTFEKLAWAFAKKEDYTSALTYAEIALNTEINEEVAFYYKEGYSFTKAYIYYKMEKFENAVDEFSNSISRIKKLATEDAFAGATSKRYNKPEYLPRADPENFYFRGKAYAALGKLQEACADWSEIQSRQPGKFAKRESIVTKKDFEDAWETCSKKMRKSL